MNQGQLEKLLTRTATTAIGVSTVRNQGAPGVMRAARKALLGLDLQRYVRVTEARFPALLDKDTEVVRAALPHGARHWGTARKCVNIFFRDVLYSRFLGDRYDFNRFEALLELPLDKHAATGLKLEEEGDGLPRWITIKGLDRYTSDAYQEVARRVAGRLRTHPVHLDLDYWRRPTIMKRM